MDQGQRIDMEFGRKLIETLGLGHLKIASLNFEVEACGRPPRLNVGIFVTAELGGMVCALVKDKRYRLVADGEPTTMTALERPAIPE